MGWLIGTARLCAKGDADDSSDLRRDAFLPSRRSQALCAVLNAGIRSPAIVTSVGERCMSSPKESSALFEAECDDRLIAVANGTMCPDFHRDEGWGRGRGHIPGSRGPSAHGFLSRGPGGPPGDQLRPQKPIAPPARTPRWVAGEVPGRRSHTVKFPSRNVGLAGGTGNSTIYNRLSCTAPRMTARGTKTRSPGKADRPVSVQLGDLRRANGNGRGA
jgi:hypothetical protein